MSDSISLTRYEELCLQLENIIFRLLIHKNKPSKIKKSEAERLYITMHSHVSTEFFVCERGELTLNVPSGTIVLKDGDAAIIPPGILHYRSSVAPDTVCHTISFICHKRNVSEGADLYKLLSPFVNGRQIIIYRNKPELYNGVARITDESSRGRILPVMHMIELLMHAVELPCQKQEPISDDSLIRSETGDIQRMMRLDQLINVFFMHDLTVDEVAKHLYISGRQLDRIVRKRYGKTLHSVIIDKRISTAEQMLLTTDMTVDKIGLAVGFGSKAGFYREFSKRYGVTPAEYRQSNSKNSK